MNVERLEGLSELAGRYDALLCDVWGVVHNGVRSFAPAVDALRRFRAGGGAVALVTNAPRPAPPVAAQLAGLGVSAGAYDALVTSGDVTRAALAAEPGARVLHIGAERDLSFYDGLDILLAPEEEAGIVSCTGLFDDTREEPEDYRPLLARLASRRLPMVCANPDIVVERGAELVWCAGALARLYEELGGGVVMAGKPYRPIYEAALAALGRPALARVLAVGDGLPTDIRGAAGMGLDVLFVTGGIHAADFGPFDAPEADRVAAVLDAEGVRAAGFLPALRWDGQNA